LILAINKWDLIEKDTNTSLQFEKALKAKMGSIDFVPVIFISALTKQRIFKLIELSIQINDERKKKIPTNKVNDVLLPEIEKSPPPATGTGREVKIKYITTGGEHYPVFIFMVNYPKQVPDNYKRFLENIIRRNFGFTGVPLTLIFKNK
jgi:GTP-binding protein